MEKKRERVIVVFLLLSLVLVTIGISYSFFTYIGKGSTENTLTTGRLTFVYDEQNRQGNGIQLTNTFPMSDAEGIGLIGNENVFDFQVLATTLGESIFYEIVGEKLESSTLTGNVVALYLTEVNGSEEKELNSISNFFSEPIVKTYAMYQNTKIEGAMGKTLYQETIPENLTDYVKNFRLRMWVSSLSTEEPNAVEGTWDYNNKTFSMKINVYANPSIRSQAEETPIDCFETDGAGTITDYKCGLDFGGDAKDAILDVTIPSSINGETITAIKRYAFVQKFLTSVTIPDSVTTIQEFAFFGNLLSSITIPDSVTTIGERAFMANQLTKVTIGKGINFIDLSAFQVDTHSNSNLKEIEYLSTTALEWNLILFGQTGYGKYTTGKFNYYEYDVDYEVFVINNLCFAIDGSTITDYKCYAGNPYDYPVITDVVLSPRITAIKDSAFENKGITDISLSDGLLSIGDRAFANNAIGEKDPGAEYPSELHLPGTLTHIGESAFEGNLIDEVVFESVAGSCGISLQTIGARAFYRGTASNPNLTFIVLLTGETSILNRLDWYQIVTGEVGKTLTAGTLVQAGFPDLSIAASCEE